MNTIYKYPFEIAEEQKISMPKGAKILCCQIQVVQPCLWAEVDPEQPKEDRFIEVHGTGHKMWPLPQDHYREYIGTIQEGNFVWHVYEHKFPNLF